MRLNFTANSFVLDAKIVKMHPHLYYEACTGKTSVMRLNFTANCFVFGSKTVIMRPELFSYTSHAR